ncbi:SsrA-binding protein SmpB [Bdellovibrio bacteriovorus]|uniref:SsrA-binding protein n=1 Tax=Bdellovibrio bacteriovorus TaxID=959 RepID=A0A150WIN3_BDEBC|nr:SsrA-binding protein SmpB [Bdellovibrio bacteriovorus]KYG63349.1 SsrA-binding protein [Bdellovibrio bacteriovorus]KYG69465.1 SsrA-binding protein [Bdellovibrio bacteriovorus]
MSILIVQENKKARFDYTIVETYEAGLQLMGSEVKSLRNKDVQLKDSYISFRGDEAFLQNAHIAEYKASSYNNHAPERLRKLLLNRKELDEIFGALKEKGYSCVPLKIYFKNGRAKLEIALVKGKKTHDKREAIKKRDVSDQIRSSLRRNR